MGTYNPKKGEAKFENEKIQEWVAKGAQLSDTMHNFLVHQGVIKGKKINVLPKKKPTQKRKELKVKK